MALLSVLKIILVFKFIKKIISSLETLQKKSNCSKHTIP